MVRCTVAGAYAEAFPLAAAYYTQENFAKVGSGPNRPSNFVFGGLGSGYDAVDCRALRTLTNKMRLKRDDGLIGIASG